MVDDRPTGLLTDAQRELVIGERDFENPTNERKMWSRVRRRIYRALRFDGIVLSEMAPDQRRKIFRYWEEQNYERHPSGLKLPKEDSHAPPAEGTDVFEMSSLRFSLERLLGFLYLGVEEGSVGDFEDVLEGAIDQVARREGRYVKDLDLIIEFGETTVLSAEAIAERVRVGDVDVTLLEVRRAIDEGALDPEEAEAVLDDFRNFAEALAASVEESERPD